MVKEINAAFLDRCVYFLVTRGSSRVWPLQLFEELKRVAGENQVYDGWNLIVIQFHRSEIECPAPPPPQLLG